MMPKIKKKNTIGREMRLCPGDITIQGTFQMCNVKHSFAIVDRHVFTFMQCI